MSLKFSVLKTGLPAHLKGTAKRAVKGAFVSTLIALTLATPITTHAANLKCEHIRPIVDMMLDFHLVHSRFTPNLEERTIDQYVKLLDSGKLYFLDEDVKAIHTMLKGSMKRLPETDCKALEDIQVLFLKRVKERADFAEKLLGPKFKFNPKTKISLDPDKRTYAKTTKDSQDFEEKYIQWQVATFLASDMKPDEARQQVARRYSRAIKAFNEQKPGDRFALYLDAFARSLDPHSNFLSAEDRDDFNIQMKLSLEGIGATLSSQDGYTVIEALVPGGAASQSGQLHNQDKIIAVGQGDDGALESIIDMPLKDVVRLIRGAKGTKVRLSVMRKSTAGASQNAMVVLTRQKINLEQDAAQIHYVDRTDKDGVKKTIGVINLPSFYLDPSPGGRSCYQDVKKLVDEATKKKVDGVVLDLATNGGGALEDAVKLTGLFFAKGNVVKTKGRDYSKTGKGGVFAHDQAEDNTDVLADDDETVNFAGPMVVLTNRLSASASEILSGALKDYRRAVIVGSDHTFGKGSVQQIRELPNGLGAFKVTVGMFYTPGGNSTQHIGVTGDVVLPGPFSVDDIGEKSLDYNLPPDHIPPFKSESAYVKSGVGAWTPLTDNVIKELAKNSAARVAKNDEFQKIAKELKESKEKNKTVTLTEIVSHKEESVAKEEKRKKEADNPALRAEEYLKRADLQEAINVDMDLISIESPVKLTTTEKSEKGS